MMISPSIVAALAALHEADVRNRAELARRRHPDPAPEAPALPTRHRRTLSGRRRRLRLV